MRFQSDFLNRVDQYAEEKHNSTGVVRKGSNIPYIAHPREVAYLVSSVTDNEHMIAASLLHDVLEDVDPNLDEDIFNRFGEEVLGYVRELTKPPRGEAQSRADYHKKSLLKMSVISQNSMTIKCGDILSNARNVIFDLPSKFANIWLHEKLDELIVLSKANPILRRNAFKMVNTQLSILSEREEARKFQNSFIQEDGTGIADVSAETQDVDGKTFAETFDAWEAAIDSGEISKYTAFVAAVDYGKKLKEVESERSTSSKRLSL